MDTEVEEGLSKLVILYFYVNVLKNLFTIFFANQNITGLLNWLIFTSLLIPLYLFELL